MLNEIPISTQLYGFDMARRRMSLRHIEAFRCVMMTGSMTEAARRMHTSQPQISRLISQLEEIALFSLFDRNGSRLTPTLDGSRFYQEVEKTFVGLDGLEAAASNIRSFGAGRLSVAAMPRLAGGMLTRIVSGFKSEHPNVLVSIHSGTASAVHTWISSGLCDAGLAMLYGDVSGVDVETVLDTRCVAILPRNHGLTARRHLKPGDFEGEPFVSFPSGTALRERIDRVFSAAGVERKIVAEADIGSAICALVASGLGVSLMNPLAAHEESKTAGLAIRRFSPPVPVSMALLYPPSRTRSRLVKAFVDYARHVMMKELATFAETESE